MPRRRRVQQPAFYQALQQPVVPRPLVLELERADAVRYLLERVLDRMRVGVHRVDAPLVARVVVFCAADPVNGRVTHVDVRTGHVDLGAQHHRAVQVLGVAHFPEARQILRRRAIPKRAVDAGFSEVAAIGAHVFSALFVHISVPGLDQVLGRAVHEIEVVAGMVEVAGAIGLPAETEPMNRVDDRVNELLLFLFRVGVVEPQVAHPAVITRQAEVHADAFGVANVQVAVGFRREARANPRRVRLPGHMVGAIAGAAAPLATRIGAVGQVRLDRLAQEVARFGAIGRRGRAWLMGGGGGQAHGEDFRRRAAVADVGRTIRGRSGFTFRNPCHTWRAICRRFRRV